MGRRGEGFDQRGGGAAQSATPLASCHRLPTSSRRPHTLPPGPLFCPPAPLLQGLEKGLPIVNLMENWDFLQVQCAMYINSDLPGLSSMYNLPGKPMRWVVGVLGFGQRVRGWGVVVVGWGGGGGGGIQGRA